MFHVVTEQSMLCCLSPSLFFCSLRDKVQLKAGGEFASADSHWYLTKDHSVDDHDDITNDTLQPTVKHLHAIEDSHGTEEAPGTSDSKS